MAAKVDRIVCTKAYKEGRKLMYRGRNSLFSYFKCPLYFSNWQPNASWALAQVLELNADLFVNPSPHCQQSVAAWTRDAVLANEGKCAGAPGDIFLACRKNQRHAPVLSLNSVWRWALRVSEAAFQMWEGRPRKLQRSWQNPDIIELLNIPTLWPLTWYAR